MDNGFTYSVGLSPEETQLVLNRREAIEGPTLLVMPVVTADEADARALWMRQRYDQGRVLYGGPRYSPTRGSWRLVGPGASSLFEGPGRLLVDEIAESLSAVIELET